MAVFVTHAMEEGWKQQWFYSIMASSVACNSVSHLEVSTQLDLSAPVVEGIVACCTCRLKQ